MRRLILVESGDACSVGTPRGPLGCGRVAVARPKLDDLGGKCARYTRASDPVLAIFGFVLLATGAALVENWESALSLGAVGMSLLLHRTIAAAISCVFCPCVSAEEKLVVHAWAMFTALRDESG